MCLSAATMASTAGSSTGATEHDLALASTNIGLPGKAINGPLFEKNHAKDLQQIFTALLGGNTKCVGLLICEAGNVDNLCTDEGMKAIDACIIQAFQEAGAAEHAKLQAGESYNEWVLQSTHKQPQIHWHSTCVAAFIADLGVQVLPPLQNMHKVDPWRCTQRFLVRMGDLQNDSWLLVHNTHQPASDNHAFPKGMRINFCKAVVRDATALAKKEPNLIGFVLMGNANCTHAQWSTAIWEVGTQLWQEGACMQKGVNKKKTETSRLHWEAM